MSNRYKKAVIDDVVSHSISPNQQENLLDLFEYTMKSVAVTLVREAKFNTSDFAVAKHNGYADFEFSMTRVDLDDRKITRDMWRGEFKKGDQRLAVLGSLE